MSERRCGRCCRCLPEALLPPGRALCLACARYFRLYRWLHRRVRLPSGACGTVERVDATGRWYGVRVEGGGMIVLAEHELPRQSARAA